MVEAEGDEPITDDLSREDRSLLEAIQRGLPVASRPFRTLGESIGQDEGDVLGRLAGLRESGILRTICAVFDTRALGYQSALAALKVAGPQVEAAAAVISAHPGVSHNYERPHAWNVWFTLATPPGADFDAQLERLAAAAGAEAFISLPSLRVFRIGVRLDLGGNGKRPAADVARRHHGSPRLALTDFDRSAIRVLQHEIPLVLEPFALLAEELDVSPDELFGWIARMREEGRLRRISGLLRHRRVGYQANGMTVWQVPADQVEAVGRYAAEIEAVSHCYERPTREDWPYNLYTMIHGKRPEDCEAVVRRIEQAFGPLAHEILYSTREFKKERIRYFVEEEPSRAATGAVTA